MNYSPFYLRVPDRLLRAYARDPLAVGVYLAIARCVVAERRAIPLSAADLVAWEGGAHGRASVMRRIRSLLEAGRLVAERGGNVKRPLLPTWGASRDNQMHLWRPDQPQHGRPNDTRVRRVPLGLLDVYVRRLDPQPGRREAIVTRYFDRPLIDLTDVGAHAIALAAAVPPTERLVALDLATAGGTCPPRELADLLAAADAGELRLETGGSIALVRPSGFGRRWIDAAVLENERAPHVSSRSHSESPSGSVSESAPLSSPALIRRLSAAVGGVV